MNSKNTGESDLQSVTSDASVNSYVRNGCVQTCLKKGLLDDCETERVGVLDYMPSTRYLKRDVEHVDQVAETVVSYDTNQHRFRSSKASVSDTVAPVDPVKYSSVVHVPPREQNIELTTFSITEYCSNGCCESSSRDRCYTVPVSSCASDDELLIPVGIDTEDCLREVIVQSDSSTSAKESSTVDTDVSLVEGHKWSSHTPRVVCPLATDPDPLCNRDAIWSYPDTARTSPIPADHTSTLSTCTTGRVSSLRSNDVSKTADKQEIEAPPGRSSSQEQSPVTEAEKEPEIHLGSTSLPPVEVISQLDPNSISRNVLYLNDYNYNIWTNAARAFCREESAAVADRTEVEKRQERRDKRKERRDLPTLKAEQVEGYVGEKEVDELLLFIMGSDKNCTKKKKVPTATLR